MPIEYKKYSFLAIFLAATLLAGFLPSSFVNAAAGINQQISFQGKVVNDDGTNVANGDYDFVFKIYTVSSGGSPVWTETRTGGNQVTVTDGIFQVNLGSVQALPGSVDFNTDNIYLGIEFNSDGEMDPRVHFTAAPYAFNAKTVGGLTVTNTTGTLTVANGETISFGGSFTTTGSNDVTLTTSGATNVTLPTTGTIATLAGSEIFTNKTIGSTGLTFSGAATDFTTAANEDLTITANGSGDIIFSVDSGTFISVTGTTDGQSALTIAAGDLTLTDGDLIVTAGDVNFTLDAGDTLNISKLAASAGDVANITASSVNAVDGLQIDLTATTDSGADSVTGLDLAFTESADADVWTAINLPNTTTTNSNTRAFVVGTGYDTILDTSSIDISGAGAITGATGYNGLIVTANTGAITTGTWNATAIGSQYGGTGIDASSSTGVPTISSGTWSVASTLGASYITVDTLDFTEFKDALTLDASTDIAVSGSDVFSITNSGSGNSFVVKDDSSDSTPFVINAAGDVTVGSGRLNFEDTNGYISRTSGTNVMAFAPSGGSSIASLANSWLQLSFGNNGSLRLGNESTGGAASTQSIIGAARGGNAGVGIHLSVAGGAGSTATTGSAGGNLSLAGGAANGSGDNNGGDVFIDGGAAVNSGTVGDIILGGTRGNIGIADTTPDSPLEILSTSTQLRLSYTDTSVDALIGVDSNEYLTLQAGTTSEINRVQIGAGGAGNSTPDFFGLDVKSDTGDPTGGFEGAMYYNTFDNKFRCYQGSAWTDCLSTGGSTNWDTIGDPSATGSILMANLAQTLDWNTNDVTAIAFDGLSITIANDAATDVFTQRAFVVANVDESGSTGTTETIAQVVNRDSNETVGTGLLIENTGAGTMTNALQIAETAGTITDGILITGTLGNILNSDSIDISGAGAITGATGVSTTTVTASSTIAANGGITFDSGADTVGAFTAAGTILMGTNIIENIGNTGTDFIASTGALTLAGVLTANGGITVAGGQNLTLSSGTGLFAQTHAPSTDATADAHTITLSAGGTGQAGTLRGFVISQSDTGTTGVYDTLAYIENLKTPETTTNGLLIVNNAASGTLTNAIHITNTAGTLTSAIVIDGTAPGTAILDTGSLDISGAGAITGATGVSTTTVTASSTIAANGGITFDSGADTVGAFTAGGTILMGTNIIENIGNTGTDFIASTGALTLAGVLTANGGISLSASQSLAAAALSYIDLGLVVHNTTANQGLRLPNAASASPSSPTSGEGYLAWDAAGNQLITYNGSAWAAVGGGSGYNLIKDEGSSLTARTTLAFLGAGVSCADNASQTECTIAGGGSSTLSGAYTAGSAGNQTITLAATQDSIIISNPTSSGTDSAFTFKVEQLNTGIDNDALYIDNRGTGDGLRIDDESGDTTPFIVDAVGRVGIGTVAISGTASTERLLQVGSETNRGNSVTYGEVVTKGYKDITALTGIKDIYVYDTTTDSDGGRWIDWATTDKLSWYTETLDDGPNDPCVIETDDRCYAAAFPRKAILVVTTNALYIFDAATNDMWMKFSQNAAGYALGIDTSNDPSSVTALNGVIYVGMHGAATTGLYALDFVNDRMWNYDDTDRSGADLGIGSRNSAITYNSDNNTNFDLGANTGWKTVNDVSATVIQASTTSVTAPIAPNNGITMLGLATDSGLAVINLSNQKVILYSEATDDDYNSVVVSRTGKLYGLNETQQQAERWSNIDDDEVNDINSTTIEKIWDQASTPALSKATPTPLANAPDALEVVEHGSMALETSDLIYVGTDQGLTEIHDNITTPTMGWSKFYNITEQTALMPGTIKGAFMFNQAATPATDSSFVANSLTAKGTTTFGVQGVRGKAITFNGSTGYLCNDQANDGTCETDADYRVGATAFNIQLWFKHSTSAPAANQTLVDHTFAAANVGGYRIYMTTTGTIVFAIDDDATAFPESTATTTQTYLDNQWHHLVAVRPNATGSTQLYIDGKYMATGNTATTNASLETGGATAIFAIGATCNAAACASGAANSFWDGQIDDVIIAAGGATTVDQLRATTADIHKAARSLYNDARPTLNRKVITVTDATTATASTIGDSAETWIPNEFAGQIVTLTGNTGVGQTRRIVSNTATVLTVTPNFSTVPDTTTDFEVDPEALYGATNSVKAIGITAEAPLGEARQMCVGTNSTTDTGGVTCYNHQAGPNIIAELFHGDSEQADDSNTEWTGGDYDDIVSIDLSGRVLVMSSEAHFWSEIGDVRLGQGLDYLAAKLFDIRNEILTDGITAVGSIGSEVGMTGGADLAENYYSNEPLLAGEVVAIDASQVAGIQKTQSAYQKDVLGVVATAPGIVLGSGEGNSYPVALVGRVPVNVTSENGFPQPGDRLTASSTPGFAMRATQAGRVIGTMIGDAPLIPYADCPIELSVTPGTSCGQVFVFVNLTDYHGMPVELAMAPSTETVGLTGGATEEGGLVGADGSVRLATTEPTREEKILAYLRQVRDTKAEKGQASSEIFTGRIAASGEIITPTIFADEIFAKRIKADSIEGLEIFTDSLKSLEEKYAGLTVPADLGSGVLANAAKEKEFSVAMKNLATDSITVQFDGSILGKLSVDGALRIGGNAEFAGETLFSKLATFLGDTIFKGRVEFEQAPTFGNDTAGFAVIDEGQQSVEVIFDESYATQPIVSVSLTVDESPLLPDADRDLKNDIKLVEKELNQAYFESDIKYIVTQKSSRGFTILLNKRAPHELSFSWVALAVNNPQTAVSETEPEIPEEVSEEIPPIILPDSTPKANEENFSVTQTLPEETTVLGEETSFSESLPLSEDPLAQ